jgi:NADH dehydrogenase
MFLTVGATGYLGGAIARGLAMQGKAVRGTVRGSSDQAMVDALLGAGVETVTADLKQRGSLDVACRDCTTVIASATTTRSRVDGDTIESVDHAGQMQLVDAASAAGVEHFIYISYSKHLETGSALTTAKRSVEQHLQGSGMTYTILRPSFFMELWLSPFLGFDLAGGKVQIFGAGENRISWIALDDVAKFAVAATGNAAARNAVIELGGPEALSPLEVVRLAERAGGRSIAVTHVPEEALRAQYAAATDSLQQSFTALMLDYVGGDAIDMQAQLAAFPITLTPVAAYIEGILQPDARAAVEA